MTMDPNITTEDELRAEGWMPSEMQWGEETYEHPRYGETRWFDVIGDVPSSQGLYIFTLERGRVNVRYCGKSEHLWMVTRGKRPGPIPQRGGNRYGRPRWAGGNRQRINALLSPHRERATRIWTRAVPGVTEAELLALEDAAIRRWELHQYGWNRR